MSFPLLVTKLHVPPVRPELVRRPRLVKQLNDGLDRKLTLISAPAGFGKTTLLGEFVAICDREVVWLSLNRGDDDPVQLAQCLVAGLQQMDSLLGRAAQSLLKSPQSPPAQGLATQLLNDICNHPTPFVLVLDDFQFIRRAESHEMLSFFIDNQPSHLHTIIATRGDPRLPLARWRARGELTEIRTFDLRFTEGEATEFLNSRMGLDLSGELVQSLGVRTEGWITGLQLAALALKETIRQGSGHTAAAFVQQFNGSDRFVIDFLVEEVLQRHPPHIVRFLRQTALLEELSAPLCDHIRSSEGESPSGSPGAAGWQDSAALLQEVEQANLFLVPLDKRREWYRYHRLFAEVLVTALDKDERKALHRRASHWYEIHDRLPSAIHHALSARDMDIAANLVRLAAPNELERASFFRLLSWLDALPEETIRSDTELATYKGFILLWQGDSNAARACADAAEASLSQQTPATTRGQFLTLRAHLSPDRGASLKYAAEALKLMDESTPFFYGAALLMQAVGLKMSGSVHEMMEAYRRLARFEERHNSFMAATAIAEMANVLNLQGKRKQAITLCQRVMEQYADDQGQPLPSLVVVLLIAAVLAFEANELDLALERATQCASMAQQTGMSFLAVQSKLYVEAPCRSAQGQKSAAWAAMQSARELMVDNHVLYPEANLDAASSEAWLHLREGNLGAAARLAATLDLPSGSFHYEQSHVPLTYVRVLLALDQHDAAAEVLQRLEAWAIAGGWERVLLSVMILRAVAAQKNGNEAEALDCLAQALPLAVKGDFRRAFLDEDLLLFELLPKLNTRPDRTAAAFVKSLMAAQSSEKRRPGRDQDRTVSSTAGRRPPAPIEPLSERELEVLALLSQGLSTPDIGESLFISAGTAKWHTVNIYRKLDVHSRVQAMIRGQELGLI